MRKIILLTFGICIIFTSVVGYASPLNQQMLDDLAKYEILQGDPDGDLRLDDNVIITEAAKFVMTLTGKREWLPTGYVYERYYLVPPKHWANSWMYPAVSSGVIDYVPKDEFNEYSEVSNMYAVKMFMRMLGYAYEKAYHGDYAIYRGKPLYVEYNDDEIFKKAKEIGLLEGLDLNPEGNATRYNMAVMAYNALDIPKMMSGFDGYIDENTGVEYFEMIILDGENGRRLETPRTFNDTYIQILEH